MSITSSINVKLPYVAVACCVILLGILLYRVANILCSSLINGLLSIQSTEIKSPLKQFAYKGLIGHALQYVILVLNSLIRLSIVIFRVGFLVVYSLLPIVLLALVLALIQHRWSETMLVLVDVFNGPFGSTLRMLVIYPLSIIDTVGIYLIPIWNLCVFTFVQAPLQLLMWMIKGDGSSNITAGLRCIGDAAPYLAAEVKKFIEANAVSCETSRVLCTNVSFGGSLCSDIDIASAAVNCLDPTTRELALDSTFEKFQMASGHFLTAIEVTCESLGILAKVICFPLTDPTFWKAVDRFANGLLSIIIVAPSSTIQRCKLAGGFSNRPSMCTPDFGSSFSLLALSAETLGTAITHWIDVLYLLVFNQQDVQTTCSFEADMSAIWQDPVTNRLFGTNFTSIIRMSSTTFALSDGVSVVYIKDKVGQISRTYAPLAWSSPVNPTYGIARVILPGGVDVQDGGVGLLGCTCNDTLATLLQCQIITKNGNSWILPVKWSLSSETQILSCNRLRISVQTIRWPQQRVVASQLSSNPITVKCKDSSTCLVGDVAIYAVPICGSSDGVQAMACFPEKLFTRGICFPYCMAIHMQHEGLQPLTMRGAAEWESGVVVAKRDCVPLASLSINEPGIRTTCSVAADAAGQYVSTSPASSDSPTARCIYDATCTTIISNKSTMPGYSSDSSVIPYIRAASGGVRLVLDGQPLVLAAGIQMRMYYSIIDSAHFVDFPTLVGNQSNEFTIEANSPIGIPTVSIEGHTPSQGPEYEKPGFVYPPPTYVQLSMPYNPATVSLEALWYVANPSYAWAYAMINYCASIGNKAETEIMILSSYSPARLWRVRYQDGSCFISSQNGNHFCAPDVATASAIDKSRDIPLMTSNDVGDTTQLSNMCTSGTQYNLWVESLEDFDELNIVLGVRRGNISDIAYLMSKNQVALGGGGKTVYYFVNKNDVSMIQESVPWKFGNLSKTDVFGLLCPALRFLPDFGSVIGHSLAAVVHLFKTPINFILNPFAIMELLSARGQQICPENSLLHSSLDDCGMSLFSFSELFQSIYKSNHAVWDIISWLSSVIAPSSTKQNPSQEADIFHSFLQGASVVADATKTVTLFDVVRVMEGLDTGIQKAVLGGRRRLLSAGNTFLSHAGSTVQSGHTAIFSLTKNIGLAVMGSPFAGADLGMLLASQDPTVQLIGSAVSSPAIAWAQFTYETCIPVVLDILTAAKNGKFTLAPLWVNIYQAVGLYDELIEHRHHQACMGFRLMLGYSSSFGKGVFYNCLAGADMARGMLTVALVVFVDIPLYRCMCVLSAGQEYVSFVGEQCMFMVPSSRKAFWQRIMVAATIQDQGPDGGGGVDGVCKSYLSGIETQTFTAFDQWTKDAEYSTEFLASFLDEILAPTTSGHASCSNIINNPSAIVLTPLPTSHYEVCAKTDTCRLRCADSLQVFEFELQRLQKAGYDVNVPPNSFLLSVESPMFNRYASASYDSITTDVIVAISSKNSSLTSATSNCMLRCGKKSNCLTVLIQKPEPPRWFRVQHYCVPDASMILSSIVNTGLDSFVLSDVDDLSSTPGLTITNVEFSMQNETTYVIMYISRFISALSFDQKETQTRSHEIRIFKPDGNEGSTYEKILTSDFLAANFLNLDMQNALFGGVVYKPQISGCYIASFVEIVSGQNGKLVFFLSFSAQIKVWTLSTDDDTVSDYSQQGYTIHAIFHWCDNSVIGSSCIPSIAFYAPCPSMCTTAACLKTCHRGLDIAIALSQQGNFLHISENDYLFLPSSHIDSGFSSSSPALKAGIVVIDQFLGIKPAPQSAGHLQYSTTYLSPTLTLAPYASNVAVLGTWTRSDVFSLIATLSKPIRDVRTHSIVNQTRAVAVPYFFQATTGGTLSSEWLQEVRVQIGSRGWMLNLFKSQTTTKSMPITLQCTPTTCSGCTSARLRLFCHAVQDCMLKKCIGAVIQTRNILCGIGNVMQQTSMHAILTWRAMFMALSEIGLLIMRGLSGEILVKIALKFPTEQFYTLICSCKDMYASVVGLATSVCQMLTSALSGGGGLDVTGRQDVGALVGESTLKATSLAGLAFNAISGSTLLPTLALHRWMICMANSTFAQSEGESGSVSIQFGDVAMDTSWLPCAQIGGLSEIVNGGDLQTSLGTVAEMFVSFTLSLMSGIGETLLYGLQLSFDSSVDFLIGMVWSLQDILYTFNARECKVPNNALRYVLWCSCNDTAYAIPKAKRYHEFTDGGLWCVGTLSLTLSDGTNSIIYNPYTMQQLSDGVKGVTNYIECLSTSPSPSSCTPPVTSSLQKLIDQGVEPIAVWAKCKSNYLQSSWDVGSGVLFMIDVDIGTEHLTQTKQKVAIAWAKSIGNDFFECMVEPGRLQIDYSSCMRIFFDIKFQKTPNSYFIYDKILVGSGGSEPPDACLVFSGLNASASPGSPLQNMMNDCSMQEGIGNTQQCELNPLVWSGTRPKKAAAASLHGTSPPTSVATDPEIIQKLYKVVIKNLQNAFEKFNSSFKDEKVSIDAALFSADGDFIHDFFDCVFLGPYTRIDVLPCDKEGLLDCPFYARDDLGGKSREFTPCFGDIMHNDFRLPFTCGSTARRSIIKYFFRNYSSAVGGKMLSGNISEKIFQTVESIYKNYTSPYSMGCLDKKTGRCHLQACSFKENGYAPCMNTNYDIPSETVSEFIIDKILVDLDDYYQFTLQNTLPWTIYYNVSGDPKLPNKVHFPFQWAEKKASATIAEKLSHFAPDIPLISYQKEEVYTMPLHGAPLNQITAGSLWGTCMALLSQAAMSIPLENDEQKSGYYEYLPVGARNIFSDLGVDMTDLNQVELLVRNITHHASQSNSPFHWHKVRKHAPSPSRVCRRMTSTSKATHVQGRLNIGPVSVTAGSGPFVVRQNEGLSFPSFGFLQYPIGDAHDACICAYNHHLSTEYCVIPVESCSSFFNHSSPTNENCDFLREICSKNQPTYDRKYADVVLNCLRGTPGVRCPELGPSDIWGLYPVDCTERECDTARSWVGTGSSDTFFEGARFLNEGRAGLRLPNYKHVNATYHNAIHYGQQSQRPSEMQQPRCFDIPDLAPSASAENDANLLDDFIKRLFPAVQLLYDSPVVAVCSRYIVEVARSEALNFMSPFSGTDAHLQVATWKTKCESKLRHLSMCNMNGIFFDVPPPSNWAILARDNGCKISLSLPKRDFHGKGQDDVYLTPWCIIVDRVRKLMYDANLCAHKSNEFGTTILTDWNYISDACALIPQPLQMIRGNLPYSMLFTSAHGRIVNDDWLSDLSPTFDLNSVEYQSSIQNDPSRDHISHVLDWWPDDLAAMPPGYHPTSPTDISELAPALFDSHYMYDPDSHTAHYVHTAARNASLVFNVAGAAGVCRSTSVTMPMFETNTNRVCSRTSKFASKDTPTMPINIPKQESGEIWPYSQSFMDTNFEPEICAATEFEIPWKIKETDPQSWSAGGIPGWQEYVSMDAQGRTIYDTSSDSYPPPSYDLSDLHTLKSGWGTCDVRWGGAPPCTSQRQCHPSISTCLPLSDPNNATLPDSICYSTASFEKSIRSRIANKQIRQPCFNTFHCQDGMVCLADGGCSSLYLHMWNDPSNKWPIEFTVLADSCGFKEKTHPYTQSTRGASPWEHVPDILHAHGMCSHHNWFSHRHATRTNICPIKDNMMSCDAEEVNWPWVFERFDLERTKRGDVPPQSMSQGKMLLTRPHPCDDRFMHLQTPKGKRMEVCSGYQGHQALINTNVYLSYDLSSSATWAESIPYPGMAQNRSLDSISKWMRTYTEATGKIDIGILNNNIETDVPLGFLGANKLSDGVVGDMAFGPSKFNFFRCSDRVACSNPPFQYNGVVTERMNPDTMTLNFTEVSLRRCGAIGYLPSWSENMCMLDIALFPLFAQILWGSEVNDNHGCGALWSRQDFLTGSAAAFVLLLDGNIQMVDMSSLASTPQTLFCERNLGFGGGRCAYIARATTRLTDLNSKDSVAVITSNINKILKSAGDVVLSAITMKISATRVYEYINKCISMVMDRILTSQSEIQNVYGTMGPSGVYLAFKLTLYEIPLSWVHHAMLITLLSTVDKTVDAPILNDNMGIGEIPLLLWAASDETATICQNEASLKLRPVLWRIICQNKHPAYTFDMGPYLKADKISADVISKSQTDIQNNLLESNGNMEVFCFKQARWDCSNLDPVSTAKCLNAQVFAHNKSACLDSPKLPGTWRNPCANPEQFSLDQMVQVSIDELVRDMNSGPSKQITDFFEDTKQKMLVAVENVAIPVNYIGGLAWGDITDNSMSIPLVRVWPIQNSIIQSVTSGFSLSSWLKEDVCLSKYDLESLCVNEKTMTSLSDPCLYSSFPPQEEINRHLLNPSESGFEDPEIIIYYADGEETDHIKVCDLLADNMHGDVCVVQYQGRKIPTADTGTGNLPIACNIIGISAPPGIEVQAFGLRLLYDDWEVLLDESKTPSLLKACSATQNSADFKKSQISSCTWKGNGQDTPIQSSWWKNGTAATGSNYDTADNDAYLSYLNGFGSLHQSFDSMSDWWPYSRQHWISNGCFSFPGVCSIRIRLEDVSKLSKGVCSRVASDLPPNCPYLLGNNQMERHAVIKSSNNRTDAFNLDRCGPCTKKSSVINSDGLFGCFLSSNNGVSSEEILTEQSIENSVQYLRNAAQLQYMLGLDVEQHIMFNGTALDVMEYLSSSVNPAIFNSLLKWGKLMTNTAPTTTESIAERTCSGSSPSGCWAGFDSRHSSTSDNMIWNRAVASPNILFTMTCKEQPYTETDFQRCNPNLDIRRSLLADFVEKRYRSQNGMWMQKVHTGMGLAWQANVAHSSVGMFSIMHSSSMRKETDVLTKWVLGSGPCSSSQTVFQDRICIESTAGNGGAFQAVHPWVGGDFNPFIGFDECHGDPILSSARGPSICPCTCEPKWACEDTSGLYNYSEKMMNLEFPDALVCGGQDFPQTRIMQANDDSDICTRARSSTLPRESILNQGVLGGVPVSHGVTADELHGHGVPTTDADFLIQGMYDIGNNGLWYGKTTLEGATFGQSYSFLKMGRDTLHPAHIAFGLDLKKTGSPLVVKAIMLLPYDDRAAYPTDVVHQWVSTLDQQWQVDKQIIHALYPQLKNPAQLIASKDWSCPLRTAIFWGGGDTSFSPLIPNPVLSNMLYKDGNGAHPLIKVRSIENNLAQYQTTNGACFYQKINADNSQRVAIPLSDEQNQCGLKGMLIMLNKDGNVPTLSKVVNHFSERCNDIMDTPDLNAELRSGEQMQSSSDSSSTTKCGVLHRLSPFLLTTKGNVGSVKRHQAGLTTRSEGGDCHMGRALLQGVLSRGNAAGRVCSLSSKNKTHAVSQCPSSSIETSSITFGRAQPIRTKDLIRKSNRVYRDEMGSSSMAGGIPAFWGPGGILLQEAEISFGRLYAASLRRVLADDLLQECQNQPGCFPLLDEWMGRDFYSKYKAGGLVSTNQTRAATAASSSSSGSSSSSTPSPSATTTNLEKGIAIDYQLWNATDWTWSFSSFDQLPVSNISNATTESTMRRKAKGTVNKDDWLRNRFGACNASYYKYAHFPGNMQTSVRSITLCEPAPTSGLQSFCTAMLQYRTDIANINCQIMGGNDCLFQPGMFYMPYMWSSTNQEFMADTVLTYYESVIKQDRFSNESFTNLCPSRNSLLGVLAQISRAQAQQCPGHQIEYLKDILNSIKSIGKDILFMGYCMVMFVVNILGSAFSNSPTALAAMSQMAIKYIADFVDTATKVIMPIFNAMINILFGGSALGNLIKDLLKFFCEAYNFAIKYYYVPGWCGIIRPAIYVILKSFAGLIGPFDTKTADSINQVWITIAGGDAGLGIDDTKQCIGNLDIQLQCSPPDSLERQDNSSEFLIQPVATRCWLDSYSGGGVLTGSSGNSYLACTSSDTCAADPLKFDSYDSKSNLIPCASCPSMPLEEMAQRFGCNTYLKRCTCGIRSQSPSECMSNSDCRQTTICGISSDIDFAREAASTTACSVCGQMGSEPVCVMDGADSIGVCACVSVNQGNSLQTCTQATAGNRINLLSSIGQCLVSTNNDISAALAPSLVLEFSTLAITKCALGISNAVCLAVRLPLADGGQYARYLAVIISMAASGGGFTGLGNANLMGRRRLLSLPSSSPIDSNPSMWNWTSSPTCNQTFANPIQNRMKAKWCIHWMLAGNSARHLFNLTHLQDHDLIGLSASNVMSIALKNQDLLLQVFGNANALRFIVRQYNGLFPVILDTFLGMSSDAFSIVNNLGKNYGSNTKTNDNKHKPKNDDIYKPIPNIYVKGSLRRRLLQSDENAVESLRMPIQTCTALEIPLQHISAAFWDTVKYYDGNVNGVKNQSIPNISNATYSWLYMLPPSKEIDKKGIGWLADMANGIVLLTSGGTTDGDRLLDAFLSDIPYNETVSNNYITGRRLLTEISSCNYTTLTFGSSHQRPLIPWLIFLIIFFMMLTCLCSPSIMITFFAWAVLFPVVLFWAVYNISPLCWPMIPPKLPHDIASEISSMVPESLEIPAYLVDQGCSVRGLLSDGTYDPRCFKQCGQEPFLMLSWQDPMAWWVCDLISVDACKFVGKFASSWEIFQDLSSSSAYYADVLAFSSRDADFVGAHRLCAFFMSYEIVFALFILVMSIFVLPSIFQAIIEIFTGAIVLLMYAYSAEMAD